MKLSEICAVAISIVVVLGFFAVMVLWFFGLAPKTSQEFTMLVGALIAKSTTVVQYWLGSSIGSKQKDATMAAFATPPGMVAPPDIGKVL